MANKSDSPVRKVAPYPIEAQCQGMGMQFSGSIQKLTRIGFLIESSAPGLRPGDKMEVRFGLPVSNYLVVAPVRVVKVYDQIKKSNDGRVYVGLVEMHFAEADMIRNEKFIRFFQAIGQKEM
ncbi:MAG: hypothetical protein CL675_04865 [Bdellovibrionaceae bacterium]|nr:hypothetical protein [Pseudobdellovibrionaceae bacterium]